MPRRAAIVWRRSRQRPLHNARMRILVVEDNAGIAAGLQANLQQRVIVRYTDAFVTLETVKGANCT